MAPLRLKAAASLADSGIHKTFSGLEMAILKISNEGIEDIMKLTKSLKEPGLLIKSVGKTTENKTKKQKS